MRRVVHVRRSGRREIAQLGEVRSLRILDAGDELRDQEVEIGIALAVRVGDHVHRRAIDRHGEIAAVIEVEAAQEILVGLPLAAMLRDDHARDRLEHLCLAHERADVELPRRDRPLARRLGDADQVLRRILDVGQIRERPLPDDHYVRVQREVHHLVDRRAGIWRDREPSLGDRGEVDQAERELAGAGGNAGERIVTAGVGDCLRGRAGLSTQLHRHTGEPAAGLVGDVSAQRRTLSLCKGRQRDEQQGDEPETTTHKALFRRDIGRALIVAAGPVVST